MRRHTYRRRRKSSHPDKSRRIKRQYGKGIERAWLDPVREAILRIFPNSKYDIHFNSRGTVTNIEVFIYCPGKNANEDDMMISLIIRENEIYIASLGRCSDPIQPVRGDEVLKRIITMGKELKHLGILRIGLLDASTIPYPFIPNTWECSISLAGYKILTSNQHHSWYNSYGFISDNYEDEVKHNTAFSKEPMIKLLEMTHAYHIYSKKQALSLNRFLSRSSTKKSKANHTNEKEIDMDINMLTEYLHRVYEGVVTPDMSIQEGIQHIHRLTQTVTSCKDPKITFYNNMMRSAIKYGIKYTRDLFYIL